MLRVYKLAYQYLYVSHNEQVATSWLRFHVLSSLLSFYRHIFSQHLNRLCLGKQPRQKVSGKLLYWNLNYKKIPRPFCDTFFENVRVAKQKWNMTLALGFFCSSVANLWPGVGEGGCRSRRPLTLLGFLLRHDLSSSSLLASFVSVAWFQQQVLLGARVGEELKGMENESKTEEHWSKVFLYT